MKPFLFALLVCNLAWPAAAANKRFVDQAKGATALLYAQDEAGTMTMYCTVTAIKREPGLSTTSLTYHYEFAGAAHCVGDDDTAHEHVAAYKDIPFYITFDASQQKKFYAARVKLLGYQHRGDDFVVFDVVSDEFWSVVPIGDERKEDEGNDVINIASPLGLGRQVFRGTISKRQLDRPVVQGNINWAGMLLLQMAGVNGGSSGSAIMSEDQEAIIGFLVGSIGTTSVTAIPASRFLEFQQRSLAGKYKWARPPIEEQ